MKIYHLVKEPNNWLLKKLWGNEVLSIFGYAFLAFSLTFSFTVNAEEPTDAPISAQIEDLKKALIALNRDLFILEEDLLFPSSTQVAVYLSLDVGTYFALDAVELVIDDEMATNYLYTERQLHALKRGGVQRVYMGNLNQGEHELTAFFTGIGPEKRPYKRAVSIAFEKDEDAQAIELKITDSTAKHQPEFTATVL
ncbi:hypothetical protein Q4561_00705 [Alteromonas sp. 1_MG-2023]|uniref:hypothetical protein n=1 Tax=Alteromonas sp. 1_MG-2023 TaxID=3062669 RepID=UPI0026E18DB9|nr:hypothetical protein [Alteromonas sp. 1_MG-2023]MDO6565565.1 hypothetical protein [Alteromonas sp. 1_MG-2023]